MRRLARPKKNKETNTDDLILQLIEAITDTYLNPSENTADKNGRMYLNLLAEEFSVTPIKVRNLRISSGVYQTEISVRINELYKSGKTIKEIPFLILTKAVSIESADNVTAAEQSSSELNALVPFFERDNKQDLYSFMRAQGIYFGSLL